MPLNLGNGLILLVEVKKSTFFFYSCLEERDTFINICLVCNLVSQCFTSQLKTQLFSTNKRKIKFDVVCFLWSLSCSALKEPPNGETCNFKTKAFLIEYGWVLGTKGITGRAILFFAGIILCIRRKLANNQISLTKDVKFAFWNKEFISSIEYSYHISFNYQWFPFAWFLSLQRL